MSGAANLQRSHRFSPRRDAARHAPVLAPPPGMARHLLFLVALLGACVAGETVEPGDHEEVSDFDPVPGDGKADGVSATFDQNNVVDDELFTGDMDVAQVQAFLEDSPYNNRSWLASYTIDGVPASQKIVDAARAERIHPLMLLVRMQVEASLVSKTVQPSQSRINAALGCGCPMAAAATPPIAGCLRSSPVAPTPSASGSMAPRIGAASGRRARAVAHSIRAP